MGEALEVALAIVPLAPADLAAVTLARKYAEALEGDSANALEVFGPKLLSVLESLRMTPRARATIVRGGVPDAPAGRSELDAARDRRGSRADRASSVDTSSS